MNFFITIKAFLRLYEAMRQANKAHNHNGQRYYVMPTSGTSGQLIIVDRANFRKLKRKGYINRNNFISDLQNECFYCTPYRNGMGALSSKAIALKKKQYYSWLDAISKAKKNGKVRK